MRKTFLTMLAMAAALSASAVEIELLTNGAGTTLDGWVNAYSGSGSDFGIQLIGDVSWFASSYNPCSLSQTVTLTDCGLSADDIQSNPTVTASGIVMTATQASGHVSKTCNVKVYELDANGNALATHTIMDRANELISPPAAFSATFSLNSSTRQLKYEMNGQDYDGWSGRYGPKFRNCSLTIDIEMIDYSQARLTKRKELANRTSDNLEDGTIYDVSANLTLSASAGSSMLSVLGTNVVAINVKRGVTLTLNGGNATGTAGITFAGLAATSSGKIEAALKSGSGSPHSLYRNFSASAGAAAANQATRIRVSIAGWVDGTVSGGYKNWAGYISSAATPSGTITRIANANI
ncbi:MAG: hypothetical protein II863_13250, partial [Kiritimatiellae bacterium]|nr:hypothetical protein [Kiritimatiellia bacterium]